jgi:hypothetical protein
MLKVSGFGFQVSGYPIRTAACDEQFGFELYAPFYKIGRIHSFDVSRLGVIRRSFFN